MLAVEARGVEKRYGAVRALGGVSLEIAEGEFFALLGPNGAGKTTLISALGGLTVPDAGTLAVMGHDVRGDYRAARRAVGIVPQEIVFDPFFTVRETLEIQSGYFGLRRNGPWIDELLERLALAGKARANMRSLSGGMKRRVMVAQALVHRPPVIVLDEPTAGVDVVARGEIWGLLEEARRDALVIISTSYLDEAEQAHRLLYLDGGRIVAAGTPAELRAAVALEVYRAWGDDGRAIARAARALPYVQGARALGRSARIEVRRERTPGPDRVLHDLAALPDGAVRVAEQIPIDMESTLLALSSPQAS